MRKGIPWLALVALLALGTAFIGWWTVPLIASIYGLVAPHRTQWLRASLAGAVAWAVLLLVTASQGPALQLAHKVGGVMAVPGPAFIALTLIFPALLAGSAAELTASARQLAQGESQREQQTN